jgi:KDO2-lipid IV(A) lauroyltransferase
VSVKRWLLEIQYLLEFLMLWPLVALIRRLSDARSRQLAIGLSRIAYRILAYDRRWCLRNLELVYGDNLTPAQRTALAMKAFENILLTRVEALRWTPEWMAANIQLEGWEATRAVLCAAARQGKGMLTLSAHLGNFELIPAHIAADGWNFSVMYRPQNNWRVERLLVGGARTKYIPQTIPRGAFSLMSLMYDLRAGKGVGFAVDVNTITKPVFVDFLGFPAASPTGAAALALATGCPVILAVSYRQADGRHRLVFNPPFELIDTGERQRDIAANTQQYMKAIEPYVLAHPEQYNWLHPRWRYRPDGTFWTLDMSYEKMAAERLGPPHQPFQDLMPRTPETQAA